MEAGEVRKEEIDRMAAAIRRELAEALARARKVPTFPKVSAFEGAWRGFGNGDAGAGAVTRVSGSVLEEVTGGLCRLPGGFTLHPKLRRWLDERREMGEGKRPVDWSLAEAWALGSLLLEGTPVRLVGQDTERGTFSQRHAVLRDRRTGARHVPLARLREGQASFTVLNTMLSELAVLGFEYGYSSADPRTLVAWEAQFGDFVNGAQPVIDQFLAAGETKWRRFSGLVLLLPHGYEGQGPEHSSAWLERFLQLSAENNWQVVYPTLPSQYFHLLRRQIHRPFRKPLVVMTPKSLLRSPVSVSPLEAFTDRDFVPLLDDPAAADPERVRRILFCSGKVYFTLAAARRERGIGDVAILRLEQLYPFPEREILLRLDRYRNAERVVWVQEEPRNMGAWSYVEPRLRACLGEREVAYVGRQEAASPATGWFALHERQEKHLIERALTSEERTWRKTSTSRG